MAGDTTPNFEPKLHAVPGQEFPIYFVVRMKEAGGQFLVLSEPLPKKQAAKKMRQIREEMARLYAKAHLGLAI